MLRVKKRFLLLIVVAFTSLLSLQARASCEVEGYINFIYSSTANTSRVFIKPKALSPGFVYGDFTHDEKMAFVATAHKAKTRVRATFDIASCPADLGEGVDPLGNLTFIATDVD